MLLLIGSAVLAAMAASPAVCSARAAVAGRTASVAPASRDAPPPPHAGSPDASPPGASTPHPSLARAASHHRAAPHGGAHRRRPVSGPWLGGAAPAAPVAPSSAGPAPVILHTPGDAASAARRRLIHVDSVDEGFLLGLPSSGGPVTYLPPQPEQEGLDPALATLAELAGLLISTGGGALLLALRLRRPAAARSARVSVALPPEARRRRPPDRRPTRLSRDTFDRLPPLLQLALLDRSGGSPPDLADATPSTAGAAPP